MERLQFFFFLAWIGEKYTSNLAYAKNMLFRKQRRFDNAQQEPKGFSSIWLWMSDYFFKAGTIRITKLLFIYSHYRRLEIKGKVKEESACERIKPKKLELGKLIWTSWWFQHCFQVFLTVLSNLAPKDYNIGLSLDYCPQTVRSFSESWFQKTLGMVSGFFK